MPPAASGVICRWRYGDGGELILDAMLSAGELLGFENPWQTAAMPQAARHTLPSGAEIRAITPPYLIATKFAAFPRPWRRRPPRQPRSRGHHLYSSTDDRSSSPRSLTPMKTYADSARPR
jgi:hypothetical protein